MSSWISRISLGLLWWLCEDLCFCVLCVFLFYEWYIDFLHDTNHWVIRVDFTASQFGFASLIIRRRSFSFFSGGRRPSFDYIQSSMRNFLDASLMLSNLPITYLPVILNISRACIWSSPPRIQIHLDAECNIENTNGWLVQYAPFLVNRHALCRVWKVLCPRVCPDPFTILFLWYQRVSSRHVWTLVCETKIYEFTRLSSTVLHELSETFIHTFGYFTQFVPQEEFYGLKLTGKFRVWFYSGTNFVSCRAS